MYQVPELEKRLYQGDLFEGTENDIGPIKTLKKHDS